MGLGSGGMYRAVVIGAHLGYDLSTTPLGGGGTVGTHLLRHWAAGGGFALLAIGSGPVPPAAGVEYVRVREGKRDPSALSVREYADFCERFSRGVTDYLRKLAGKIDPGTTCLVHNDISEAPDFAALRALGYRQIGIFHVDVVDYVARIYLRGAVGAPALARAFRGLERAGISRFLPRIVRLIFAKQQECVRHCDLLVVPSRGMAEVLGLSYPEARDKVRVVPWGAIVDPPEGEVPDIRARYGIDPHTPVLLTLSRISPEKGQDLLLSALRIWERRMGRRLVLFVCGAPAFMHGRRYFGRLRRLARRLRRVEVHFPGYVAGNEKWGFLRAADLYVFPSRHESYGLTLAEALAAGLPVLTTDHRSAHDLVRPGFGMVVPPRPRAIYRGLVELFADPGRLREMGKRAAEFSASLKFERAAGALASLARSLVSPR